MERPVDDCSQAKVAKLQRFTAILIFINLTDKPNRCKFKVGVKNLADGEFC